MRRTLAIVAGVVLGNAIYFALAFGVLQPIQQASGHSPEEWLPVVFLLVMPVSLFLGGALTGYLAREIPAPRWPLAMCHSPGLYTFLAGAPFIFFRTIASFQIFMLVAAVGWVVGSTPGVLLGTRLYRRRSDR